MGCRLLRDPLSLGLTPLHPEKWGKNWQKNQFYPCQTALVANGCEQHEEGIADQTFLGEDMKDSSNKSSAYT
jgi:hypothetical protein